MTLQHKRSIPVPNADSEVQGGLPQRRADRSLAADLGEVVDEARQTLTDLGMRPYRVFSVVERWSGGAIGRGQPKVIQSTELVPPPFVDFMPLARRYGSAGSVERGDIILRKISPRYTEDELFALVRPVTTPGEAAYIEIVQDGRFGALGALPRRRRFVVSGTPWLDQARFEWLVKVRAQDNARTRRGAPVRG